MTATIWLVAVRTQGVVFTHSVYSPGQEEVRPDIRRAVIGSGEGIVPGSRSAPFIACIVLWFTAGHELINCPHKWRVLCTLS